MKLIVGLGNPGSEHLNNRHNIGFMALDNLSKHYEFEDWKSKFVPLVGPYILTQEIRLLRPLTKIKQPTITTNIYELKIIKLNIGQAMKWKDKFLDIIVSSAGQITKLSPVESIDLNELNDTINLNYISNFRIMKHFHPLLKNSKISNFVIKNNFKLLSLRNRIKIIKKKILDERNSS